MIDTIPFRLENKWGDLIHGEVRVKEGLQYAPAVVMCHGFKGFKDWGPFPAWGRQLAEAGFVSVLFNFSYNGIAPEQPTEFTRLDQFAENTYSRERHDVATVLTATCRGALPQASVDASRVGLLGHSRGGGIAILEAASNERVRALVTWSAVSSFLDRFTIQQIQDWQTKGYTEILNSRTHQVMRLGRALYEDAIAHQNSLNILRAASRISKPWLIVHAKDDETVAYKEARQLAEAAPRAEMFDAMNGHTFGGKHPFEGQVPFTLQIVFNRTLNFFKKTLM